MHAAYRADQRRRGLRDSTIATRRRITDAFDAWLPGPVETATAEDIERWLDSRDLSARSRYTYLSALCAFYGYLQRRGLIDANPAADIARPRLHRLVPRPAAPADIDFAIGQAEPQMAAWLCLATFQGFRVMEIAQLRREHVLTEHDPPLLLVENGKGGHEAVLTLNRTVEEQLRRHGMPHTGLVFRTRDGNPFKAGTVGRYISGYLRGLGINATAHMLRHLYCTTVWQRTHDLRLTQEMARHQSPTTTAGYTVFDSERAGAVLRDLSLNGS